MTGRIADMSREAYDLEDRVSWSMIKPLRRSPAHCLQALKGKGTEAMDLGIAIHVATLEPDEFLKRFAYWRGPDRRTKAGKDAWAAFEAESAGKTVLESEDYETVCSMAKSVRQSEQAMEYLRKGRPEVSVLWEYDGIECKSRLDWLCHSILDLKSTFDASPKGFAKQVANLDYLGQMAFYQDAHESVTGERLPVAFLAVEKEPPYVAQIYTVPDEYLLMGRSLYRSLLAKWATCRARDEWGGYSNAALELVLPSWAFQQSE